MLKWSQRQRQQSKMCENSGFVMLKKNCSIWLSHITFWNSVIESSLTYIKREIVSPCMWLFDCEIGQKLNLLRNIVYFFFYSNWFFCLNESVFVNKNRWCSFIFSTKKIKIFTQIWKLNDAYDPDYFDLNTVFTMIHHFDE